MKRLKGKPVWVKDGDEIDASLNLNKIGIKTYSRVNVRYFDIPTSVLIAVICFTVAILVGALN